MDLDRLPVARGLGGYPLAKIGDCICLLDPFRTPTVDGGTRVRPILPDFSPAGRNPWVIAPVGDGTGCKFSPTGINGLPAFNLLFGGGGQSPICAFSPVIEGPLTIMAVLQFHVPTTASAFIDYYPNANNGNRVLINSGTAREISITGKGGSVTSATLLLTADAPCLVTAVYDGPRSVVRLNRAQVAAGDVGGTTLAGAKLGSCCGEVGGANFDGLFGIMGIWRGALMFGQILRGEDIMNQQYRLGFAQA